MNKPPILCDLHAGNPFGPQPPSPLTVSTVLYFILIPSVLLHTTPHARRGRLIRDGLRPLPPTPNKTNLPHNFHERCGIPRGFSSGSPENRTTQLSSPVRESRGASRPFPGKTLSHNFHHRGCSPRGLSYVLVSLPQGPDDRSCQESFVLHRD